ncbi:TonB-dependent receptor, partial [Escherichia coli]|nr:TonB-dependent receptor [Escherichia coli]
VGGQFSLRDMHVVGDEKFLPKNSAQQFGLCTLQSIDLGPFKAEAAARFEHNIVDAQADADIGNPAYNRTFNSFSASLGASYAVAEG